MNIELVAVSHAQTHACTLHCFTDFFMPLATVMLLCFCVVLPAVWHLSVNAFCVALSLLMVIEGFE